MVGFLNGGSRLYRLSSTHAHAGACALSRHPLYPCEIKTYMYNMYMYMCMYMCMYMYFRSVKRSPITLQVNMYRKSATLQSSSSTTVPYNRVDVGNALGMPTCTVLA